MKMFWIGLSLAVSTIVALGGWMRWYRPPAPAEPRPAVVGVLQFTANNLSTLRGFKAGMTDLGYIEGETVRYRFEGPVNRIVDLDAALQRLLAHRPDLLFTSPTPATLAAKRATAASKLPVVFAPVNDPIAAGIVDAIHHPGQNITGVRLGASDGKRLQWLAEISPGIRRIFLPYHRHDKSAITSLRNAESAAVKLGLQILARPVADREDLDVVLKTVPDGIDAIFLPRDGMVMSRIDAFIRLSKERRVVLSTPRLDQVEKGALMGYGFIGFEIGRQAAGLADQILGGQSPGDLPIETAEDYLFINLETAREIGLDIEAYVLRQAHRLVRGTDGKGPS